MRNGQPMHQTEMIFSQGPVYYFSLSFFSPPPPHQVPHTSHSHSITLLLPGFTFNAFHFQNNNRLVARFQFPETIKSVSEFSSEFLSVGGKKRSTGVRREQTLGEQHVILFILTASTLEMTESGGGRKNAFLILLHQIHSHIVLLFKVQIILVRHRVVQYNT